MYIKIYDGRNRFYQYDLNQKLILEDIGDVTSLHFANDDLDYAIVQVVYTDGDKKVCDVPNSMLTHRGRLYVYACIESNDAESTIDMLTLDIVSRPKPSDYIEPSEVHTLTTLRVEVQKLKENGLKVEFPSEYVTESELTGKGYITETQARTLIDEVITDALNSEV